MTPEETQRKTARVEAISQQIEAIPAMLDGTLLTKHNRVRRVDGSIRTSPEHYTFQYRGADGKRMWKRIPRDAKAAVERLVRAGERYRALEREYAALLTELSLADDKKKTHESAATPPNPGAHRGRFASRRDGPGRRRWLPCHTQGVGR